MNLTLFTKSTIDLSTIEQTLEFNQELKSLTSNNKNEIYKHIKYNKYEDMIATIKKSIVSSNHNIDLTSGRMKPSISDITNAMINCCNMSILRTVNSENTLFIEDPNTGLMTSSTKYLESIISDISSHVIVDKSNRSKTMSVTILLVIDEIKKTSQKVRDKLSTMSVIRDFKKLSSDYVVANNGYVLHLPTKTYLLTSKVTTHFDIVNTNAFNFLPDEKITDERKKRSIVNRQIIDRVFNDWTDNNEELQLLLWQILYAVIQNNNRNKLFIFVGPGGNGKSTYMSIAAKIAGVKYTKYANLHQFGDSNAINQFDMSTKLIIGDDLATNHRLGDVALSNLKSIVTSNPISVPVKYQDNKVVVTNAVIMQGTNTELTIFENNAAMKSRLVIIYWTSTDFRLNKPVDITFELDELIENQEFLDDLVMTCLEKVKDFDKFTIPECVQDATNDMIETNDAIKQFMDEYWYRINKFEKIPIKLLYAKYTKWCKEINPKGGVMKLQTFVKELNQKSEDYRFKQTDKSKKTTFKLYSQTGCILESLDLNEYDNVDLSQQAYITSLDSATTEEVDMFIDLHHPLERELSDEESQLLLLAVYQRNRSDLNSIYDSYS